MAASINDFIYINLVSFDREEAVITLSLLLSASLCSDEELQAMGEAIGFEGNVRETIDQVGSKIDVNWKEMLDKTIELNSKS